MIPFKKLRCHLKEQRKYKRQLARLQRCGNYQVTKINGLRVAKGDNLNFGHIFDGGGILIVEEIFKNDEYHFDIGHPSVVIDIGMNIGLASLYFATRDDVVNVYGFEPFKPTFEKAMFNFEINEKYAGKIHPHNYGLGDTDKELTLEYYSKTPGRMSTVKPVDEIWRSARSATSKETIQIKNASEVLSAIIDNHRDQKIVVKCDTEGAEKEIFESLDSKEILKKIDMVMLEYHFSYDILLEDILKHNGFIFFKQRTGTSKAGEFGIIRAVRK